MKDGVAGKKDKTENVREILDKKNLTKANNYTQNGLKIMLL